MSLALAYHESGHALVGLAQGRELDLVAVSLDGGITRWAEPLAGDRTPEALERGLVVLFAGQVAESYAPSSPHPDAIQRASLNGGYRLADPYAILDDLDPDVPEPGPAGGPEDDEIIQRFLEELDDETTEDRAKTLAVELIERKHIVGHLELLADRLYLSGRLTGDDVKAILYATPV
jgi:hypothetical protein